MSGYWRNGARWIADGTYRSVRGDKVFRVSHMLQIGVLWVVTGLECSP